MGYMQGLSALILEGPLHNHPLAFAQGAPLPQAIKSHSASQQCRVLLGAQPACLSHAMFMAYARASRLAQQCFNCATAVDDDGVTVMTVKRLLCQFGYQGKQLAG